MRIAVGMSGGVDSSLAAHLLREEGHDVFGITAWMWDSPAPGPSRRSCCGSLDASRGARAAAQALGIEHEVLDLAADFEREVVNDAAACYASGLTPNPCVICNATVRFPRLVAAARARGAEAIATGHYARLVPGGDGRVCLLRGVDAAHDQSYFLFAVSQEHLAFARFPLGGMTKAEVRARAAEIGHPSAGRSSSQDLCFAARGRAGLLAAERSPASSRPGEIRFIDGRVIGRHGGLTRYTVGQRKRIGVAWTEALYVVALLPGENAVVVGPESALDRASFGVSRVRWSAGAARQGPVRSRVQIRYHARDVPGEVRMTGDETADVTLDEPASAVAPGQVAVFYDAGRGEEVLGGGWIEP